MHGPSHRQLLTDQLTARPYPTPPFLPAVPFAASDDFQSKYLLKTFKEGPSGKAGDIAFVTSGVQAMGLYFDRYGRERAAGLRGEDGWEQACCGFSFTHLCNAAYLFVAAVHPPDLFLLFLC
jgi:hypothetical protein